MSAESTTPVEVPPAPITLDDIRHKALALRTGVTDEVQEQATQRRSQIAIGGVVALLAIVSAAYFAGVQAGRRPGGARR